MPPDSKLFVAGFDLAELQAAARNWNNNEMAARQARLYTDLAAVTKRFINERKSFEEVLAPDGIAELSSAMYCLEWKALCDSAEAKRQRLRKLGYWKRLWRAVKGRT